MILLHPAEVDTLARAGVRRLSRRSPKMACLMSPPARKIKLRHPRPKVQLHGASLREGLFFFEQLVLNREQ